MLGSCDWSVRRRLIRMDDETAVSVGAPTTNRSFFPPARAPMKSKRSSYPRTSYIRFCKDKRQLLPPNLRNAERERLLGQWWRALPEAEKAAYTAYAAAEGAVHGEGAEEQYTEKAQFNIVDAAYAYHPVAAAATEWVLAAYQCVDAPSAPRDAHAAATLGSGWTSEGTLGDRWSVYWNAKRAQTATRGSESAVPPAGPPAATPTAAIPAATPLAPLAPPPLRPALGPRQPLEPRPETAPRPAMGIPRMRPSLGIIGGERRAAVLSSYKRAYSLSAYGTMPDRCGPPPVPALPIIAPFRVPTIAPLMAWHTGGTSGWHKGGPSAPSAPVAPALPPVPMGTSVVLAKPVTPVVAAAPLQLQLQELLMQTLEQMAEEEAEVM